MKNILIPTDFSAYSEAAIRAGSRLAKSTGARISLLHVLRISPDWLKLPVAKQQEFPKIEAALVDAQVQIDKLSKSTLLKGIKVETFIKGGPAYEEIIQVAKINNVDMIIMGAHGADDSGKVFIGSTAQRVLRLAPCPVLSIKKDFQKKRIDRIVVASDLKNESKPALKLAATLGKAFKASIDIVFVNTPSSFSDQGEVLKQFEKISSVFNGISLNFHIHNNFNLEQGIFNFSVGQNADLIVMAAHHRKGKAHYVVGVTESLLFRSEIPILSVGI